MKLVFLIVPDGQADQVVETLVGQGYPVTRLASTGGFLRMGQSLLLSALDDEQVEPVLRLAQAEVGVVGHPPQSQGSEEASGRGTVAFVCQLERQENF